MGLTGDFIGLRRLRRNVESLAQPDGKARVDLLAHVQTEVTGLLKEEFAKGIGPDGSAWQQTKSGRPALISKKLAGAFSSRIDRGIVRFTGKSKRDMLMAHQLGHTFKARKVAADKQFLSFNSKGKLVSARRVLKGSAFTGVMLRRGASQVFAAAHKIGERVLPARPIYPEGTLPTRWQEGIERGLVVGMEKWHERAEK